MQLLERITHRNSIARLACVSTIPFFILLMDFFFSPILINTRITRVATGLNDLFQYNRVYLGIFRGNDVFVSLDDDVRDPEYLNYLEGRPTALVVSVFVSPGDDAVPGALVAAVRSRLQSVSPEDQIRLQNISEQLRGSNEGRAIDFPLHIPVSKQAAFPIDALLVVTLPSGKAKDAIRDGIRRAVRLAETKSVRNLIIPCIGIKWENSKGGTNTPLPLFFTTLFDSLPVATHPHRLYLSLYKSWPTFELQDAVSALDSAWQSTPVEEAETFPIHHRNTRLAEIFLFPCLISCGILARLTVRNVLIIVVVFLSMGVGAKTAIDLIAADQSPQLNLIIQLAYLLILSVGLPFIVRWNPKEIFEEPIKVDC